MNTYTYPRPETVPDKLVPDGTIIYCRAVYEHEHDIVRMLIDFRQP